MKLSELTSTVSKHLAKQAPDVALSEIREFLRQSDPTLASLSRLNELVVRVTEKAKTASEMNIRRIAVLSGNQTSVFLIQSIRCHLAREGILAEFFEGGYNGISLEVFDPTSQFYTFKPDQVLIALSWRDINAPLAGKDSDEEAAQTVYDHVKTFRALWRRIHDHLGVPVIQHLFDHPPFALLGTAERNFPGSLRNIIDHLNQEVVKSAPAYVSLLDIDFLSAQIGLRNWNSEKDYVTTKLPFALRYLNDYAQLFTAMYRELIAKQRKCLVLDLDNTLWGGVVGDDGYEGVEIGPGSPKGEAHLAFCEYVKALKTRGIILAINSKNEVEVASRVFKYREEMPLQLEDFSAIVCNWQDKPGNIRLIAKELNIGLNSIVFVDDNPSECEFVRHELPEVFTVELPDEPSKFANHLDQLRLFDTQKLTASDKNRTASYQALNRAKEDMENAGNLEDFLSSLEMKSFVTQAGPEHLDRMVQMELRTNQFNVTTRRYRSDQIEEILRQANAYWLVFKLIDRYADHGVVSTLLAFQEEDTLRIDSWLMSCRVFSRTLEQYSLNRLLGIAQSTGVRKIIGEYVETERNMPVENLYPKLGFQPQGSDKRWWEFEISESMKPLETFVQK